MKWSLFVRVSLPDGGPMTDHEIDHFFIAHASSNQERCLMSGVFSFQGLLPLLTVEDCSDHTHHPCPCRQVKRSLSLSVPLQDQLFVSHQRLDQVNVLPECGQVEGGVALLVLLLVLHSPLPQQLVDQPEVFSVGRVMQHSEAVLVFDVPANVSPQFQPSLRRPILTCCSFFSADIPLPARSGPLLSRVGGGGRVNNNQLSHLSPR